MQHTMRIHIYKFLFLLLSSLSLAYAQMGIPTQFDGRIATDLFYKNKPLPAPLALKLLKESDNQIDLSKLDPNPNTDLWQPTRFEDPSDDDIKIEYLDTIKYHSSFLSGDGLHRFNANIATEQRLLTFYIGKNIHSVLMRQALLRKIGYKMPPVKRVEKVKIQFDDLTQKELFISQLSDNTATDPEDRWIISNKKKETSIIVQDLLVTLNTEPIYNFSFGYMDKSLVRGRRLLNALIVPYNLVHFPESINLMPWTAGRIINNQVYLAHPNNADFSTTWEDARWITRKILSLDKQDWKEIVEASQTPISVQVILLEKLLSRRNSLTQLLNLDAVEFPIDSNPSNGEYLIDGKLVPHNWEGYGSRFAHGDPESPLSASELSEYLGSKGVGVLIDAAVSGINSIPQLSTDIQAQNQAQLDQIVAEATANSVTSGQSQQIPMKTWMFPIGHAQLILNRNIVAGSYLGTDNLIQLVDTVGVSLGAGMYMGIAGMPAPFGGVGVSAQGNYTRTYAHVKPITSVSKARKEKFTNMAVPFLSRKYGKAFKEVLNDEFNTLPPDEQKTKIENALAIFKENMSVGESFIITDTIGTGITGIASFNFTPWLAAQVGVAPGHTVMSRLHIHRKDENTIQIYKDLGNVGRIGISLGLSAGIPVIKGSMTFSKGRARTRFYKIDINQNNNLQIVEYLSALKNLMFNGSLRQLKRLQKPWEVLHKFGEDDYKLGIFTLRMNKIKSKSYFSLREPEGELKNFFRHYRGSVIGNDYQTYTAELIDFFIGKLSSNASVTTGLGGGNPGNTFYGKAKNRISTFEAEILPGGLLGQPFVKINRIWNGWRMKRKKAQKLLERIRRDYNFRFYNTEVLNDTDKLFLYNISLQFTFFTEGIEHMLTLPKEALRAIFRKHYQKNLFGGEESEKIFGNGFNSFYKNLEKVFKHAKTAKWHLYADNLIDALQIAEKKLTVEGLKQLMGSERNIYIVSKIDGFRDGNEDADNAPNFYNDPSMSYYSNPYISNSIGEFGSLGPSRASGPISYYLRLTGMNTGEFYANWIMGRIY